MNKIFASRSAAEDVFRNLEKEGVPKKKILKAFSLAGKKQDPIYQHLLNLKVVEKKKVKTETNGQPLELAAYGTDVRILGKITGGETFVTRELGDACWNCGKSGHIGANCSEEAKVIGTSPIPTSPIPTSPELRCDMCFYLGHDESNCPSYQWRDSIKQGKLNEFGNRELPGGVVFVLPKESYPVIVGLQKSNVTPASSQNGLQSVKKMGTEAAELASAMHQMERLKSFEAGVICDIDPPLYRQLGVAGLLPLSDE